MTKWMYVFAASALGCGCDSSGPDGGPPATCLLIRDDHGDCSAEALCSPQTCGGGVVCCYWNDDEDRWVDLQVSCGACVVDAGVDAP
jgi:hypothetical protein